MSRADQSICRFTTKLVSSSVCAADLRANAGAAPAVAAAALATGDGGCLLGETACHCACAETLPIPAAMIAGVASVVPVSPAMHLAAAFLPAPFDSPLRPPIA